MHRFHPHRAGFAPDLSLPFPAFLLLSSNQQACFGLSPFIHHVFGVWIWFVGFKSAHCHPLSQDMLLSNGYARFSGVHRWSSPSPPSPGRWYVLPTRQQAHGLNRPVEPPTAPSSTFCNNPRWFRTIPPFPIAGRLSLGDAWFSRANQEGSHPARLTAAVFVFVCLYYWAYLLYLSPLVYSYFGVWVHVTKYTCQITFNGDPGFVASVPRAKGPASLEALPLYTFVLRFLFGLPRPYCLFSFFL